MIRTGYDSDGSGDGRGGRSGGAGSKKTLSVQEQMVRLLFVAYCSWLLRGRFVISVVDLRVRQNCRRLLFVASGWFYSSGGVSLQNSDRRVLCSSHSSTVARLSKRQCSAASEGFTLTFYPHALCLSLSLSQQADLDALMATDDSPPAELTDYLSIQPRRTEMVMKWLNEPFLKTALEGKDFFVLVYRTLVLYVSDFRAKPSARIV
jgi:hypothetical protein